VFSLLRGGRAGSFHQEIALSITSEVIERWTQGGYSQRAMATVSSQPAVGPLLREWRKRRRRTQLDLALDAHISARHLSFVETGRSMPSRQMVLILAEQLEIPFRERNQLLLAAGYAPAFPERSLEDPELAPVREALDLVLARHEPYPAIVLDRRWNIVAANAATLRLAEWLDPALLEPPNNMQRVVMLLASRIVNLDEVLAYFVERLEHQVAVTGDEELAALLTELPGYPASIREQSPGSEAAARGILMPLRIRAPNGSELSLFGTVATFGTAVEVTTSELSIESLFPADAATAEVLRDLARQRP
jgi:transcriptional regulator with XRE-family HTH domain